MPERPSAIKQLNSLLGAVTIAHEIIFETRRELIAADRGNPEQARLVAESGRSRRSSCPAYRRPLVSSPPGGRSRACSTARERRGCSPNWNLSWTTSSPRSTPCSTGSEKSRPYCARCWTRRARPKRVGLPLPARSDRPKREPRRGTPRCRSAPPAPEARQRVRKALSRAGWSAPAALPSAPAPSGACRESLAKGVLPLDKCSHGSRGPSAVFKSGTRSKRSGLSLVRTTPARIDQAQDPFGGEEATR